MGLRLCHEIYQVGAVAVGRWAIVVVAAVVVVVVVINQCLPVCRPH